MPNLKDQDEIDAYYLYDSARPRAAGVMWPALVEQRIDKLFEIALRPDKAIHNQLFQPGGPLGNYAVKVRLAYLLGWFGKDFYDDLLRISKIRNRFAHQVGAKDFSDQQIGDWLKGMHAYQLLPQMLEESKKRAESDKTAHNLSVLLIVEGNLQDRQRGFRFCIDLMLHELDKYAENMKRNLADLSSNWAVAETPTPSKAKKDDGPASP